MVSPEPEVFTLETVPEVFLPRAPLAKVLTQVQFSRTPALVTAEAESALADRLERYPVRRHGMAAAIAVSLGVPGVPMAPLASPMKSFSETTGTWQVTVTETSVALETTDYHTRDDFCERAHEVLMAVASVALPPVVDRVGLRYIDRLTGGYVGRVNEYVVPQLRVLHGSVDESLVLEHSVSDSMIRISDDERLQVRSGMLPPNGSFDPALAPVPEQTWVLDLDVFTVQAGFAFDPDELTSRLRRYADHAYSFFRFATTEALQSEFGAGTKHVEQK